MFQLLRSYRFFVALLLFISFSSTQFPFALVHTHAPAMICNTSDQGQGICQHKAHLATTQDHCPACSIHIEKNLLLTCLLQEYKIIRSPLSGQAIFKRLHSSSAELTSLRGPPCVAA